MQMLAKLRPWFWACLVALLLPLSAFGQYHKYKIKEGPTEPQTRSYVAQYVMVVVLAGLAIAAICKPSYRQKKEEPLGV